MKTFIISADAKIIRGKTVVFFDMECLEWSSLHTITFLMPFKLLREFKAARLSLRPHFLCSWGLTWTLTPDSCRLDFLYQREDGAQVWLMKRSVSVYLSLEIFLFSFFHLALKSVQNSNQSMKKWLVGTSFSPVFGFSPKYRTKSWKLSRYTQLLIQVLELKYTIITKYFLCKTNYKLPNLGEQRKWGEINFSPDLLWTFVSWQEASVCSFRAAKKPTVTAYSGLVFQFNQTSQVNFSFPLFLKTLTVHHQWAKSQDNTDADRLSHCCLTDPRIFIYNISHAYTFCDKKKTFLIKEKPLGCFKDFSSFLFFMADFLRSSSACVSQAGVSVTAKSVWSLSECLASNTHTHTRAVKSDILWLAAGWKLHLSDSWRIWNNL